LDRRCTQLLDEVALPNGFVLPGDDLGSAHLHVARAVARRCERRAVGLRDAGLLDNPDLIRWLNRVSDYLHLLALAESGTATRV
jgi:cob(I)alamin adenosyltransferase